MMPDWFYAGSFHVLCILSLGGSGLALWRLHRLEGFVFPQVALRPRKEQKGKEQKGKR